MNKLLSNNLLEIFTWSCISGSKRYDVIVWVEQLSRPNEINIINSEVRTNKKNIL